MAKENKKRFPLYVVKRIGNSNRKIWLIRVIGIVVAFLFSGIICSAFKPGSFLTYYENMFIGCFDPTDFSTLIDLLLLIAIYFMMTLAITPAFKMKFWNIGGEGQTLIACLATAGILKFAPHSWPTWLALIVSLVGALIAGAIWAVVPAIFKAFFNTNETLFTLMMNYIATGLVSLCISIWITNGSQVFGLLPMDRQIPSIADIDYLIPIIVIALVSVVVILYLKKNKGGYEISVVGSSTNTARYVGINVKKVIIRTMIISGLISGLVGYLITAGVNFTVSTDVVGGKGFTSVLIAWLGHFEPLEMLLYAGLVAIFEQGSIKAATTLNMSSKNFSAIVTGTFFFVIIACEFFANYEIKIHKKINPQADVLAVEGPLESNIEPKKEEDK